MDEPPSKSARDTAGRIFVSQLVGAAIKSPSGKVLGKIKDVVAHLESSAAPVVNGCVIRTAGGESHFVPSAQVSGLDETTIRLKTEVVDSRPFERRPGEILLVKDLRDKEVVHVGRARVFRVNDVALIPHGQQWVVWGVDVGTGALLSQLGMARFARKHLRQELLPWEEVEMFTRTLPQSLHLIHDKIRKLHPADIARVFHDLGYHQSSELLRDLPDELAADVVEDLAPEYQAVLISGMERERAADILEEMPPDAAADVLNDILEEDPEAAAELVQSMESEDAAIVERLRVYADNTAGGLMTTDFVTVPASFSVSQTLTLLQREKEELPEVIDPLLVVPERGSGQLVGLVSLRDVVLAQPDAVLENIMQTEIVVRHVDDSAREAARTIAHYKLQALPILDETERLVGVISIHSALDVSIPPDWSRRLPRSFLGGRASG